MWFKIINTKLYIVTTKLLSTKFHSNQVTFCMSDRHIGSAILSFRILSSGRNQRSQNSRVPNLIPIKQLFVLAIAILNPLFWVSELWARFHNQRPQKPPSTKYHLNQVTFCTFVRHIGSAILNLLIQKRLFFSESDYVTRSEWLQNSIKGFPIKDEKKTESKSEFFPFFSRITRHIYEMAHVS